MFINSARLDSKPVKSLANMVSRHSTMGSYVLLPRDIIICLHSPSVFISSARLDSKLVKSLANMVSRHSTMELHLTPTGYYNLPPLTQCVHQLGQTWLESGEVVGQHGELLLDQLLAVTWRLWQDALTFGPHSLHLLSASVHRVHNFLK